MQKELCKMLNTKLGTLSFVDKMAGLVMVAEKAEERGAGLNDMGGNMPAKIAKYPIAYDVNGKACEVAGTMDYMIPDGTLKGISYFEDQGITPPTLNRNSFDYEARLRFVCWMNTSKISTTDTEITAKAQAYIIAALCQNPFNMGIFTKVQINVRAIPPRNKSIFSPYTYEESVVQYLIPPYEYFAIDFAVKFSIPNTCLASIGNNPAVC